MAEDDDNQEEFPLEWRIDNALDVIEDVLHTVRMGYDTDSTEEILERLKKELEA